MDENQVYYDDAAGAGTSIVNSPPMGVMTLEPLTLSNPESRSYRKIAQRAEVTATQEHYRARLAQTAIVNTAALSSIADTVTDAVPSSSQSIRAIVHTYAVSAAEKIARW